MDVRSTVGLFIKAVVSLVFAGIFYIGWMTVAIPIFKSGAGVVARGICWLSAPVVTAVGFATGVVIAERVTKARKSKFLDILIWPLIGCAIGAGAVWWIGPMLIVFAMFAVGTVSVAVREVVLSEKKEI